MTSKNIIHLAHVLHVFGGHVVMMMSLHFMLSLFQYSFQITRFCYYTLHYHYCKYSFQIMRNPHQEECEASVSILLRSRCQNEFQIMRSLCQEKCEADVSIFLRSRCKNEFQTMWSLCQEECEADVKILGSRARISLISVMRKIDIAFSGNQWQFRKS